MILNDIQNPDINEIAINRSYEEAYDEDELDSLLRKLEKHMLANPFFENVSRLPDLEDMRKTVRCQLGHVYKVHEEVPKRIRRFRYDNT